MDNILFRIVLLGLLVSGVHAQGDRRPLLRASLEIEDVAIQPSGRVWLTTRTFDVYTSRIGDMNWKQHQLFFEVTSKLEIKRVRRMMFLSETVGFVGGDIQSSERGSPNSCVLRTTNGGNTWSPSLIGNDTLAVCEQMKPAGDGSITMLDRVGRLWQSRDTGSTWIRLKLPEAIAGSPSLEIDMASAKMGASIDFSRKIHFTLNGWQTLISGRPSPKKILNRQPSMLEHLGWSRDFVIWAEKLVLIEGRDIFHTSTSDLNWERWDSVRSICVDDNRAFLYTLNANGTLYKLAVGNPVPEPLAHGLLMPRIMRAAHGFTIVYRHDTGPLVISDGKTTMMRTYSSKGEIGEPRRLQRDNDTEWGLDWQEHNDEFVDVYKRQLPNGVWQRDTFLLAQKLMFRCIGDDSLLIGGGSSVVHYNGKTRKASRYELRQPLNSFFRAPLNKVRFFVERNEYDMTTRSWTEFRPKGKDFVCFESLDSSGRGVNGSQFIRSIPKDSIMALLETMNRESNNYPKASALVVSSQDIAEYHTMLDTVFKHDGFFDTLDMYRAPPSVNDLVGVCKEQFKNVPNVLSSLSDQELGQAIRAFRTVSPDRHVKYFVEFENQAGDIVDVEMENQDEIHLPMMMPWTVSYRGQSWHWYGMAMGNFYQSALPQSVIPPIVTEILKPKWLLLAVGAYLDAKEYGRFHRWSLERH